MSDTPTKSSFLGTSGLIDDVDITIADTTRFDFDSDYRDGEVCLFILDFEDEEGEEHSQFYSIGSGYEPKKGSKNLIAVKEDSGEPPERGFNRSTNYMKLLASAIEAGALPVLEERGEAFEASIWHGLKFHVGQVEQPKFKGRDGQEGGGGTVLLFTDYLGDGEKAKKSTSSKKSAKKDEGEGEDETEEKSEKGGAGDGLKTAERAKLKKVAKAADDHDSFMETAISELDLSNEAEKLIEDEEFFETLKDE